MHHFDTWGFTPFLIRNAINQVVGTLVGAETRLMQDTVFE